MTSHVSSFLSLALASTLLVAGPAFAAPDDARPDAGDVRAGQIDQPPRPPRPGDNPVVPDEARHHMRTEPGRTPPDRHPAPPHHYDRSEPRGPRMRPEPPQRPEDFRRHDPRWNDERPAPPAPPHRYGRPEPRGPHMRPEPPQRPEDFRRHDPRRNDERPAPPVHPHRYDRPEPRGPHMRPEPPAHPGGPDRTAPDAIPFRYER